MDLLLFPLFSCLLSIFFPTSKGKNLVGLLGKWVHPKELNSFPLVITSVLFNADQKKKIVNTPAHFCSPLPASIAFCWGSSQSLDSPDLWNVWFTQIISVSWHVLWWQTHIPFCRGRWEPATEFPPPWVPGRVPVPPSPCQGTGSGAVG